LLESVKTRIKEAVSKGQRRDTIYFTDPYMAINDEFTKRADNVPQTIPPDLDDAQKHTYCITLLLVPYHDIVHIPPDWMLFVQGLKASFFFEFFQDFAPSLLAEFLKQYALTDWKDYIKGVMPIADHARKTKQNGISYLVVDPTSESADKSSRILTSLSAIQNMIGQRISS